MERPCSARDSKATVPSSLDTTRPFLPVICGRGEGQAVSWCGHGSVCLSPSGAPGCGGAADLWPGRRPCPGLRLSTGTATTAGVCRDPARNAQAQGTQGCGCVGMPPQHCLLPLPRHLPGLAGTGSGRQGEQEPRSRRCRHGAYLRHPLRAPQLVNELVQGVDRQLPAQHQDLGQQVLLQPLHPLQDAGSVQIPLQGARGACRARGAGDGPVITATAPLMVGLGLGPKDKGVPASPSDGAGVRTILPTPRLCVSPALPLPSPLGLCHHL